MQEYTIIWTLKLTKERHDLIGQFMNIKLHKVLEEQGVGEGGHNLCLICVSFGFKFMDFRSLVNIARISGLDFILIPRFLGKGSHLYVACWSVGDQDQDLWSAESVLDRLIVPLKVLDCLIFYGSKVK